MKIAAGEDDQLQNRVIYPLLTVCHTNPGACNSGDTVEANDYKLKRLGVVGLTV